MKFVKHTDKKVIEVYLLDDEDKILLIDSVPSLENKYNEDLLISMAVGKMVKLAVNKNIIPINEIDDVEVKALKCVSKQAEINEDFK